MARKSRHTKSEQDAPEAPLSIVYRDPKTLKFWDKNPRHNDAAAKKLAALIEVHGFKVPVTMREEDGIIYKGNCRLKAALLLDLKSIPVMVVSYPREQDAINEAISDNVASEWAAVNEDALYDILQEGTAVEVARNTGLEVSQIEGLRAEPDEPDDEPRPSKAHSRTCPKCGHEWEE